MAEIIQFQPGPDCGFAGICNKNCLEAEMVYQAIDDDNNGLESGNLADVLQRSKCKTKEAKEARLRAQEYLDSKKL